MNRTKFDSHTKAAEFLARSEGLDLTDEEYHLIRESHSNGQTAEIAASLIASKRIRKALDDHRHTLENAARSSDRFSRRLARATWCLVLATVGLVIATFFMASSHG